MDCGYNSLSDAEVYFNVPKCITIESCDEFLKELYRIHNNERSKRLKRKMTIKELSEYIEWVKDFMATELMMVVEPQRIENE